MPTSVVQHSWPLQRDRESVVAERVFLREHVRACVFESLKHSVAAVLHTCLTAVTTGEPQLSLQSQLKCYEVEFPLFIYLFLQAGNSQTVTVTTHNWLRASGLLLLMLLLLPVGNV